MPATEARDAVLGALRIAGVDIADGGRTPLPTAKTRAVIDRLCDASPEQLAEERVDLRELVRGILDWHAPRATKSVVRTAGRGLTATRADGAPLWPNAVEALSYVAVWTPLLEPDRIDRVLAHALDNSDCAYAPIRYAADPAAKLVKLVGHYQPARLEALAITMWDSVHEARWWDVCGGLGTSPDGALRRRRRRRPKGDELEAEMEARTRAISTIGGDAGEAVTKLVAGGVTHWTPASAALLREVRLEGSALSEAVSFATESHDDPDVYILCAQLVDLPPTARPLNPAPVMVDALEFMLADTVPTESLPKKPTSWGALYPEGSLNEYPIAAVLKAWDWAELPGVPGAVAELIRSPHSLFENRDYMGNCTGGYSQRCENGDYVLWKLHYREELYNWSVRRQGPADMWQTSEINSRFNSGAVPAELREGISALLARANRGQRPE